jgi:hypothetical protein
MTDPLIHSRWRRLAIAALITVMFAVTIVITARAAGRSPGFAFVVNWLLMAWAISVGRYVRFRCPAGYYTVRSFEKGGRIYDYLGVRWYQRLLRPFLWKVNPRLLRSQRDGRKTVMDSTHDPDGGHLAIFIVIVFLTVRAAALGWWDSVAWLVLFNLLHNAYPVMSMRQIRARLAQRPRRWAAANESA